MSIVQLGEEEVAKRERSISKILKPLSRIANGPASERRGGSNGEIIFGAHEGSAIKSNFTEWRFATTAPGFWANYYEIWKLVNEKRRQFCLDKAYLTIYEGDSEFLCLHCDPHFTQTTMAEKAIYKKGPHLHVECAKTPFPRAHIALGGMYVNQTLDSAQSLTKALNWSIQMIRDEVLDRINPA